MVQSRFVVAPAVAYHLTAIMNDRATARIGAVARCRRAIEAASRHARRTASIDVPLLGLSLRVYRVTLLGRPFDLITRRRPTYESVVGLVPVRPERNRPRRRGSSATPVFSEHEATALAFELLGAENEEELDQFLGKVFKSVARAAKNVGRGVTDAGKLIGKAIDKVNKIVPIKSLMKSVEKGLDSVNKFVPIGSVLSLTPMGMTMRLAKNLGRVAAGENVFKVAGNMVKSGLKDVGQVMQAASSVAAFVPGIGTGVGAALGAAGALAQGAPITEAVLAAAKGALPGGAIAAAAFDVASGLAQGKSLSEAALNAARNQVPGGPAARAAFDAGLALAKGKKLQDVALAAAGTALPSSPLSTTALNFANKVARGENLQSAAVSAAGGALMRRADTTARNQLGRFAPATP